MKLEKSKNAGKNMAFELFQNIYSIIIPFVQRTLMIIYLGMEYTGLGGLFTSILSVLSLAELGVGSAMIYSMYKPIVEDDDGTIIKLLNLYKKYYRIIGTFICGLGLMITPFLKYLIKADTCPKDLNIYILFLMTLASTVLTYWLYAYKGSVLQAYQKNYIITKVSMEVTIVFDILQIVFIVIFRNYYLYLLCAIIRIIVTNLFIAHRTNKIFPQYKKLSGSLDKLEKRKILSDVKDIFLNKIGEVLTNSFDSIVISTFLGLTVLAQYQNYLYIWTAVITLFGVVFNATRAGIGNSLVSEDRNKVYSDLKTFTFIVIWIITIMASGFSNLFQPFIELWVGKKNVLNYNIVICLCVFAALRFLDYLFSTYKSASGIWHADRFRPLISGVVNLGFNLVTVHFWGLYGVIFSTVVCLILIDIPWLICNIFKTIFKDFSIGKYVIFCLKYFLCSIISVTLSVWVCNFVSFQGTIQIIIRLFVAMLISNGVMFILTFNENEFRHSKEIVIKMLKR